MITLYYDLVSSPCRALLILFKKAGIQIKEEAISIEKGDHRNKDISRLHQLPVIHDGDFQLSESVAIIRYVLEKYCAEDFWYPKNIQTRARVDEYLNWAAHNMYSLAANSEAPEMTFYRKFQECKLTGTVEGRGELEKNLKKALDELEELWTGTPYIAGEDLTIADVFVACDVEQTRLFGIDPLENKPKLSAWFGRIKTQLEPHFSEIHRNLCQSEKMLTNQQ